MLVTSKRKHLVRVSGDGDEITLLGTKLGHPVKSEMAKCNKRGGM